MSNESAKAVFAAMRATAKGEITPEVGVAVVKEICGDHSQHIDVPVKRGGEIHIRFTGNRIACAVPEERD